MIKRIRFATRAGTDFPAAWRTAVAAALAAPPDARPSRVAVCTTLPDFTPEPPYDGVGLEWFADREHLLRFESWLSSPAGERVGDSLGAAVVVADSPVVVAEEHILRGVDWLGERWRTGGERLKHMAVARRADGLSPAQFRERWKGRAGKVGTVVIPDEARGTAYTQNHPLPDRQWAYDAVNEVHVADVAGLRARIAFFAEKMTPAAEADLVRESWFLAAREEVLTECR